MDSMVFMIFIVGCIGVICFIVCKVVLVEVFVVGEFCIVDNFKFVGLFFFCFFWFFKYFCYFDSYLVFYWVFVDFKTVPGDLVQFRIKSPVTALKCFGGKKDV